MYNCQLSAVMVVRIILFLNVRDTTFGDFKTVSKLITYDV